jgi:two-component system sensor histidine kinase KdpD
VLAARPPALPARRVAAGAALLAAGLPLLTVLLVPHRSPDAVATPVLLVLLLVAASAAVGGARVSVPGAVAGALLLNWFFTPPYGTFAVQRPDHVVVLVVFLAVAIGVSAVMALAARRAADAVLARAEAEALSSLAGAALSKQETLPGVLERVLAVFGMHEVALLERVDGEQRLVERVGEAGGGDVEVGVDAGPGLLLRLRGPEMLAQDQRVLRSFAEAAATALEGRRLAARAAEAAAFEAADRTRTALLAAVGHDLRTPLAALKAAVGSLRADDVGWTPKDRDVLLGTIEESADRLHALVENLLDASRLEAGVVSAAPEPVGLLEVVDRALLSVGERDRGRVHLDVPESLPDALADPGLAERVVANVLLNAVSHTPAGSLVTVRGTARGDVVRCDVVDHGPGLTAEQRSRVFFPFQRLGDRGPAGLGLGLSVARRLAEAMGGQLLPMETPGGGLTMRLLLPAATAGAP